MMTSKEMADEIWRRVDASSRSSAVKKSKVYSIVAVAVCLAVVIGLSVALPSFPVEDVAAVGTPGTATLFSGGAVGGYILVGVIAFMLGAFAAIFCVRIRRKK